MINALQSDLTINVLASIIASPSSSAPASSGANTRSGAALAGGWRSTTSTRTPINRDNFPEFNLNNFRLGTHYFLRNNDPTAARQLIFIGEQNNVRSQLEPTEQKVYARLYEKYDGRKIADDTAEYLENFARIVRLIGKSFPNLGIEILLHDLSNPSHSLVALENNVTGRNLRDGTTNLVIDLKKRPAPARGQTQLRAEHRRAPIQVHHHPDHPTGIRRGRRGLHQHRRELPHRGSADRHGSKLGSRPSSNRDAARRKHSQPRRIRQGAKRPKAL